MYSNAKFCNDVRSNDTDIHANVKILHALIDALVTPFEVEVTRERFHGIEVTMIYATEFRVRRWVALTKGWCKCILHWCLPS